MPQNSNNNAKFDDAPAAWITTESGTHIPIDENGAPVGGPDFAKGEDFTQAKISFGGATTKTFAASIADAQNAVQQENPRKAWRVTAHSQEELEQDYPGAKLHITPGGSTVAVTTDGDIISVCKKPGDTVTGQKLLAMAVENGGTKLDSYAGNHGFYVKCGFEAVSWCEFDEQYAPQGWTKGKDEAEPVIFYRYTGNNTQSKKVSDVLSSIPASADYGEAQATRDNMILGGTS